ncbi:Macrophage killing protein with similarity to conjugation protein [Legionella massiliensis]|uniref:Macrophage killing protein with similarity to conjugation protein n=1 Tax=Legionella massiliensis TaxID=1034943 RepID=A0A078KWW9_9GAMM|nr:DotI/IcmL family type IV secretion protein [Legionella massiliensis]CDZ76269.1 Macrophage killing protein with similarity to conjugation protein [Legionella massiliensis]CEE12007.1 Macrophage killing protein with similarity to conjugation protein [Legionella massiliensis]
MTKMRAYAALILFAFSLTARSTPDETQLAVWANEAIVATYTYNYKDFIERQKQIAKYFTAGGWTDYSNVFTASKIPDAVQANSYFVSAVATLPPTIKAKGDNHWQAEMPLLVIYKNPQYQQKQTLDITLDFGIASPGQGVRGLAITSLQAQTSSEPCKCEAAKEEAAPTTAAPSQPQGAK